MNDRQEDKLSSYYAVEQLGLQNPAVISSVTALETAFIDLRQTIADIGVANIKQNQTTEGATKTKEEWREQIIGTAKEMAGAMNSYGIRTNNNELIARIEHTDTEYLRSRDTRIKEICQELHDEALSLVLELGPYGVLIGDLNAFQNDINTYHSMIGGPQVVYGNIKAATEDLGNLFKRGGKLVVVMNGIVLRFKKTNFDFYIKFQVAKKVIKRGGRKKKPKAPEPPENG